MRISDWSSDVCSSDLRFEVERYLEYHGDKLVRRFDANSYLLLTKAMDLHDVSRGRGDLATAMARLQAPVLAIGVASDILYPLYQSARSEEHTSELQSLMRISYAVFCLKKKIISSTLTQYTSSYLHQRHHT